MTLPPSVPLRKRRVTSGKSSSHALTRVVLGACGSSSFTLRGREAPLRNRDKFLELSLRPNPGRFTTEGTENHRGAARILNARALKRDRPVMGAPFDRSPLTNEPVNEMGVIRGAARILNARALKRDRPVMGAPFDRSPLTNEPVNEMGVIFLWALVAGRLGFQVESMQGRYPDCEAKREVAPGKWQRVKIELEYESKNFALHGHDPKDCDVIVCWRHNWKECPEEIEVIELSRVIE